MEIRFNLTGADRKALVEAIAGIVGWAPVYKKAPTFAYVVQNYTIDKNGTLICDERTNSGAVHSLLSELVAQGFVYEDIPGDDSADTDTPAAPFMEDSGADTDSDALPDETAPAEDDATGDCNGGGNVLVADPLSLASDVDAGSETSPGEATPDRLVIEVPLEGFTATALDNLDKLVASNADLIKKSLGAPCLPIMREDDRLRFPWFTLGASEGEVAVYTQFVLMLCEMAKKQKRVVAKEKPAESEKYAFRCFLLRLGYIGHEYSAARKLLLTNLPGDGSFKSGKRKERDEESQTTA